MERGKGEGGKGVRGEGGVRESQKAVLSAIMNSHRLFAVVGRGSKIRKKISFSSYFFCMRRG